MASATMEDSDFEKLRKALEQVTTKFGSVEDIMDAFGLSTLPTAQRYGILFGCLVFVCTVIAVIALLVLGGSFKRIAEQTETGKPTVPQTFTARKERSLLLERLLDARFRMMKENYPNQKTTEGMTNLTKMLLNVSPDSKGIAELVDMDLPKKEKDDKMITYVPPGYEENYIAAYRKCQDAPGGAILSGRPEARFEAYARAFAGCGNFTSLSYRRSYARLYESFACKDHATDDEFSKLFKERPQDLIGGHTRLEMLEANRHLKPLYRMTSGDPTLDCHAYDPDQVWCFLEDGPFENPDQLRQSFVFQLVANEAAFAIVQTLTHKVLGAVKLTKDDPKNLTIQLEPPILHPKSVGKIEELEACYLLMDRLFALGYRRVQMAVDSQDGQSKKLATRLGFTLEAVLPKHMIIKDSSRDSTIYGMLNSDWTKGARNAIYKKLYGLTALRADVANNKKEEELDEQAKVLKERKEKEENVEKDKNA